MRFCKGGVTAAVVWIALVGTPRAALATPNFPEAIQKHLQLASAPDCTLCHIGTPSRGTVTAPFGATMRQRGLAAYDEGSLTTALDALAAEQKDSDGDGTSDIRELKDGTDPNAGAGGSGIITPEYGCAAARMQPTHRGPAFLFIVAGIAVLRRARKRRVVRESDSP